MKKKILVISGIAMFALLMAINLQYALDGYGISQNSLHHEVLAQTSSGGSGSGSGSTSSGGSNGSGSGTAKGKECTPYDHTSSLLFQVNCIPFFFQQKLKCKPAQQDRCCNPADQKSCSGGLGWPPNYN